MMESSKQQIYLREQAAGESLYNSCWIRSGVSKGSNLDVEGVNLSKWLYSGMRTTFLIGKFLGEKSLLWVSSIIIRVAPRILHFRPFEDEGVFCFYNKNGGEKYVRY